jgi:polar amino acid transport system substrate-binding protein
MMKAQRIISAALSFGLVLACIDATAEAQQVPDPRVADLINAGEVRVGVGLSVVGAIQDSATGKLRGVAMDIAQALATRLGVKLLPVLYPSPPRVLDGLKEGAWDIGFMAIDPSRLDQVGFSPAYLNVDSTYLVPAGSSIRNNAEADQPGLRIVVARNSVEEILLRRMLRQAELMIETTAAAGLNALRAGNADVLASSRPTLLQLSAGLPNSRVLEDRYGVVQIAIAVPKAQAQRLSYISDFIEEAKATGLVQRAIEHAGLRGFQVAPPRSSNTQ